MQLSLHAEYALRVLLYVGSRPGVVVSTEEISRVYQISRNHLVRVVQTLGELGYLNVRTGRAGGVTLGMDPGLIRLGDVVRQAEPSLRIAECFDTESNACIITPICTLKPLLNKALAAFLSTLNDYTLADLLSHGAQRKFAAAFVNISRRSNEP